MVSVIGIVGPIGSGKDTVADYMAQKYGYTVFSFRDIIAGMMKTEGIELARENMQKFAREKRDAEGENVFSRAILQKITESGCQKAVVKELRTSGDIKPLLKHFRTGMKVIKVVAPAELRFERMKARQRPGDPQTLEEFRQQEKREEELGYTKASNYTDFMVFNTGTREELFAQVDKVMGSLNRETALVKRRFL